MSTSTPGRVTLAQFVAQRRNCRSRAEENGHSGRLSYGSQKRIPLMPAGDPWRARILGKASQEAQLRVPAEPDPPAPQAEAAAPRDEPRPGARQPVPNPQPGARPPSYRLATFAMLTWVLALALAAYDEYWSLPHAASINAALFLLAVMVIISLSITLRRARAWRRSHVVLTSEMHDATTGLPNHRYLHYRLDEEVARARRYARPLALVVVGVNSLQAVNEQYGWTCGDQVLHHLATVLQSRRRGSDTVTRLADDHFALILPECEGQGARAFVERLEEHLARAPARVHVDGKQFDLWVGICAGVAVLEDAVERASELVGRAEADLRAAKDERNQRRRRWLSA